MANERAARRLGRMLGVQRPANIVSEGTDRFDVGQVRLGLRLRAALAIPVAIVGVGKVGRAGPERVMPSDAEITRMVRQSKLPRGWTLVRLTDASWCWAVIGRY